MAAAVAAATRLSGSGEASAQAAATPGGANVVWDKAPCRFCGTGCHVQVGVQNNRVVAIAGDPLSKQPDYKKCAVRIRKRPKQ